MPDPREKTEQAEKTPADAVTSPSDSFPASNEFELIRRMVQGISDRYDVLAEAGRGGMGVVYRARDRETDEIIALKTLRPELAADSRLVERFKRELRLARRITHKNVCRVYDLHRTPALCFVTMEFVDGENLRSVLHSRGTLELKEGIAVARQVCEALREAHKQGVVHRDLKPENVMIDRSGTVKVMDFGIARSLDAISTVTGGTLGTPAYMAPEQAEGQPVDPRTDIYSLGLILYEVFTGVVAFTADTPIALAWKQVHEPPVHPRDLEPSLPPRLEKVILRCLEKDPARRYQTAEELDITLDKLGTQPIQETRSVGKRPWFITASADELPRPPRLVPLTLLTLAQVLYLTLYLVALAKFETIHSVLIQHLPNAGRLAAEVVRVTAMLGVALRLYLLAGIGFNYKGLGDDFRRISFLLIPLDGFWALSPLLLFAAGKLGSLAFAYTVALAFLPLSQRTLVRMAYPVTPTLK
jgi:serine/threonine protein kinase